MKTKIVFVAATITVFLAGGLISFVYLSYFSRANTPSYESAQPSAPTQQKTAAIASPSAEPLPTVVMEDSYSNPFEQQTAPYENPFNNLSK